MNRKIISIILLGSLVILSAFSSVSADRGPHRLQNFEYGSTQGNQKSGNCMCTCDCDFSKTEDDFYGWMEDEFDPAYESDWMEDGFDNAYETDWMNDEFDPTYESEWMNDKFDYTTESDLMSDEFDPAYESDWMSDEFDYTTESDWISDEFDTASESDWMSGEIDPASESDWMVDEVAAESGPTVQSSWDYSRTIGQAAIDVQTPELSGLADSELENQLNEAFSAQAESMIRAFESDQLDSETEGGFEFSAFGYDLLQDDEDQLVIAVYTSMIGASSEIFAEYYTIGKENGNLVTLSELFDGIDYITPIRDYLLGEMLTANRTEGASYWVQDGSESDPFAAELEMILRSAEERHHFYLNEDGEIVITFDPYEAGPGSMGNPEFVIPADVVK